MPLQTLAYTGTKGELKRFNYGLKGLVGMPGDRSFESLARLWGLGASERVKKYMRYEFGAGPTHWEEEQAKRKKSYEAWQLLAKKEWETEAAEELALWIKAQDLLPLSLERVNPFLHGWKN